MSYVEKPRLVIGVGDGVIEPKVPSPADYAPPDENLKLRAVFGYNGELNSNLAYNNNGEFIYTTASVGIIQDYQGKQKYHIGHNLTISAMAVDSKRRLIATGEVECHDRPPTIRIWDALNGRLICEIPSELNHSNSSFGHLLIGKIKALAFSPDSTQLVAIGDDTNHSVTLLKCRVRWTSYKRIFHHSATRNSVEFACWRDNNSFYTGGEGHVNLWDINKQEFISCKFGHCPIDDITCGTVVDKLLVCGTKSGNLITFTDDHVFRYKKIHKTAIHAICLFNDGFITSGEDKCIIYWNKECRPQFGWELVQMLPLIKNADHFRLGNVMSLTTINNRIAFGDSFGNIYEVTIDGKKLTTGSLLVHQGQNKRLLGQCIPSPLNKDIFTTCGDDRTLFFWDINTKMPIKVIKFDYSPTSISYHPKKPIIVVTLEPHEMQNEDQEIEVKSNFLLIDVLTYQTIFTSPPIADDEIHLVRFSPNGKTLILCCKDKKIITYDLSTPQIKLYGEYNESDHLVECLDFTFDSRIVKFQCNDDNHTIFYLYAEHCKPVVLASEINKYKWATTTCLKSWDVKGLFNIKKGMVFSSLRLCTSNEQKSLLLVIDKKSSIRLYKYPVIDESSMYKTFVGHSTLIESASFTSGGLGVLTYSKQEGTILIWEFINSE